MDFLPILLEASIIQVLFTSVEQGGPLESSHAHVCWFVGRHYLAKSSCALLNGSVVEGFRLIELLSVLSSYLICMDILLSGPRCGVPQGGVHCVSRAIIDKSLSRSIEFGFVSYHLSQIQSSLLRKFHFWVSGSEHLTGVRLWVNKAGSKGRLVWSVLTMVCRMSLWLSSCSISARCCV